MPSSHSDSESSRRAELERIKRQSKEHLEMIEAALERTRPLVEGGKHSDTAEPDAAARGETDSGREKDAGKRGRGPDESDSPKGGNKG